MYNVDHGWFVVTMYIADIQQYLYTVMDWIFGPIFKEMKPFFVYNFVSLYMVLD